MIDSLHGKDLEELLAEGTKLLAGVPSLGGGGAPIPSSGVVVEEAPAAKVEDNLAAQESEDDSDADMGLGLFDD